MFGSLGEDGLFCETTAYDPRSPYSASKAASDHLVRAWHHTYGLPVIVTNCSNNYGPYHFPEKLIPLMIINALEGLKLPVYGKGANVRDWLYVEDHARALVTAVLEGAVGETYCIGGRSEKTNLDVVETICALMDELAPNAKIGARRTLISFVADRPGHDLRYAIDAGKISSELGWEPRETFESGLRKTVEWYLANRSWWERIRSRRLSRRAAGGRCVILLFGANGQLGQEMVRASAARGVPLVALSRAEADIADAAAVRDAIARHEPALVVNAAAYTKVDLAETEVEAARQGNEIGPAVLGEACARGRHSAGPHLDRLRVRRHQADGLCRDRSGRARSAAMGAARRRASARCAPRRRAT